MRHRPLRVGSSSIGFLSLLPASQLSPLTSNSLLKGTGIWAGGTLLTGVSIGTWLDADAAATLTFAPATAQQPVAGHTRVSAGGAVAIVASPVRVT